MKGSWGNQQEISLVLVLVNTGKNPVHRDNTGFCTQLSMPACLAPVVDRAVCSSI